MQQQQHHNSSSYSDDHHTAVTPDDRHASSIHHGEMSGPRPTGRAIVKSTNGRTPLATVPAPPQPQQLHHHNQQHHHHHHNSLNQSASAKPGTADSGSGSKPRDGSTNSKRRPPQLTRAEKFAELERMPRVPFNSALASVADNRMNTGQVYQGEGECHNIAARIHFKYRCK